MFGLHAAEPVGVAELLRDAPRSLRQLSTEHSDGWGVAIRHDAWTVHRSTACAALCPQFDAVVGTLQTRLLIAHVRKKTVGPTSLANTHPFRRGDFVFAHNGTVAVAPLAARSSTARLAEIEGATDSESLFAFILTHIDEAGDVERGVAAAVRELHAIRDLGAASFLLSCGTRLYAHRLGRTLFTLARGTTTLVASEPLSAEPWVEIPERGLVAIDREPHAIAA
jgi:glutamine amidotransferase